MDLFYRFGVDLSATLATNISKFWQNFHRKALPVCVARKPNYWPSFLCESDER
jgi:hypothetical protein